MSGSDLWDYDDKLNESKKSLSIGKDIDDLSSFEFSESPQKLSIVDNSINNVPSKIEKNSEVPWKNSLDDELSSEGEDLYTASNFDIAPKTDSSSKLKKKSIRKFDEWETSSKLQHPRKSVESKNKTSKKLDSSKPKKIKRPFQEAIQVSDSGPLHDSYLKWQNSSTLPTSTAKIVKDRKAPSSSPNLSKEKVEKKQKGKKEIPKTMTPSNPPKPKDNDNILLIDIVGSGGSSNPLSVVNNPISTTENRNRKKLEEFKPRIKKEQKQKQKIDEVETNTKEVKKSSIDTNKHVYSTIKPSNPKKSEYSSLRNQKIAQSLPMIVKSSESVKTSKTSKKAVKSKPVDSKILGSVSTKTRLYVDESFLFSKRASPRSILYYLCSSRIAKISVDPHFDPLTPVLEMKDIYDKSTLEDFKFWQREEIGSIQMRRYHLLTDKLRLVDTFLKSPSHDYTSLILLLEYIRSSLEENMFFKLLQSREKILIVYRRYLERQHDFQGLIKLYKYLKMKDELLMTKIRMSLTHHKFHEDNPNINERYKYDIHYLTKCTKNAKKILSSKKSSNEVTKEYFDQVTSHCVLLDRERQIEIYDSKVASLEKEEIYNLHPRNCVYGTPSADFLRYLLFYHAYSDPSKLSCPSKNAEKFKCSEKRFKYLVIDARSEIRDWGHVKRSLKLDDKGRLIKKKGVNLSIEHYLNIITKYDPPDNVLRFFLEFVDSLENRYEMAIRYHAYQVAILTAVKLGSKERLHSLKKSVERHYGGKKLSSCVEQISYYLSKDIQPPKKGMINKFMVFFGK